MAGQANCKWRTRLGDEHNYWQGKAVHWQFPVESDKAGQHDATKMDGRSQQVLEESYKVRNGPTEGSGSC
jgi:hypothetical protein